MSGISSIGILLSQTSSLQAEQTNLAALNQELASGTQYDSLTDYSTTDVSNLLNFQNSVTQQKGYISTMQTVQTRLSMYDQTMTDMESVASTAGALASGNQSYDPSKLSSLQAQAKNYLSDVTQDLNQKVGDRYVYAGTRYSTAPVADLTTLTNTPSATPVSGPTLPAYDSELVNNGVTSDANAYVEDTVAINSGYNVTYGVTSTNPAFQQLISGLQFLNKATTDTTSATYQSDMTQASTLLASALNSIQSLHTAVAGNQNTLTTETTTANTDITNLQGQISNIQAADLTSVSTQINLLQTQLSASYSATATIEQLSILKYL